MEKRCKSASGIGQTTEIDCAKKKGRTTVQVRECCFVGLEVRHASHLAFLSGVTLVTGMELTRIISNPRFTVARMLL